MSHGKQFTLYTNVFGPNGWYVLLLTPSLKQLTESWSLGLVTRKVAIVLEELGLTYESIYLTFEKGEHKAPDYLGINPNGRIPALIDHKNNNFVVWSVKGSMTTYTFTHLKCMTQGIPGDNPVLSQQVRSRVQDLFHRRGQVPRTSMARVPDLWPRVSPPRSVRSRTQA